MTQTVLKDSALWSFLVLPVCFVRSMKYRSFWDKKKLISVIHKVSKLITRWKFNNRNLVFLLMKNYNMTAIYALKMKSEKGFHQQSNF